MQNQLMHKSQQHHPKHSKNPGNKSLCAELRLDQSTKMGLNLKK